MRTKKIISARKIGKRKTIDLEVNHKNHNFYAEGIVTSNSHSTSYAIITAYTTYLKFKYPLEFMTNCLNMARFEQKPHVETARIIKELPYFGLKIYPPSIHSKQFYFHPYKDGIRIGIAGLRGVAEKTLKQLKGLDIQLTDKFHLFDTFKEVGLNITVFESFAKAGCFSDFSDNRGRLCLEARAWNFLTDREKNLIRPFGVKYQWDILQILAEIKEGTLVDGKGKPIMKLEGTEKRKSRWGSFYAKFAPYKTKYIEYSKNKFLNNYLAEKNVCGFAFTNELYEIYVEKMPELSRIEDIKSGEAEEWYFVGQITEILSRTSKNGNRYRKYIVEGDTDEIEVFFFYDGKNDIELEEKDICYFKISKGDNGMIFLKGVSKIQ